MVKWSYEQSATKAWNRIQQTFEPTARKIFSPGGKNLLKWVISPLVKHSHKKLHVLLIYLALSLSTFIAFEQVRHNEFVIYDDDAYVTQNPHVNGGITYESIIWAFTTSHSNNWHPLTRLSHMLDCELFGLDPFWHHLNNLFFHVANTLLLFWVLKKMTGAVWPSGFVAAVFALHPLHVESVAWVAERKDVLSGFFWMLTMAAYTRYAERPGVGRYLLVVFVFCLGLMAKPMLVTLPFALLLLDYWPLRRFQLGGQSETKNLPQPELVKVSYQSSPTWHLVREKIPLFGLGVVASVIAIVVQKGAGAIVPLKNLPLNFRIENALVSYVAYINKMIYPSSLAVLYPYPTNSSLLLSQSIVCFMKLAAISAFVIYMSRRRRYLAMGWLWYLGILVPVIGFVQVGTQAMADRYTYLPAVGIFIMVAWGGAELLGQRRYRKIVLGILAGLMLASLLICTRIQVRHWRNDFTLFGHTIEVTERNTIVYNYYGNALLKKTRLEEATQKFHEALRINPNHPLTHYNLGLIMMRKGKYKEAIKHFNEALRVKPSWPKAHEKLREALKKTGQN